MNKKEKLKRFIKLVSEVTSLIEEYKIEVYSYIETGVPVGSIYRTFGTNHGQISLNFTVEYSSKGYVETYSIRVNSEYAEVPATFCATDDNHEAERMFEDLGEDLRSLFYDKHVCEPELEIEEDEE